MPRRKVVEDGALLEKALLVISEKGPENFTLTDIGNAVGLAPATLLQRFGSKQRLLVLAARQAGAGQRRQLLELKNRRLSWRAELLELLCQVPDGLGSRTEIANSLGLLKLDMTDPELHPIARQLFKNLRRRIQQLLSLGQAQGEIGPAVDLKAVTWALDALRHGLVIQWTLSGSLSLGRWMRKAVREYLEKLQ